MEYQLSRDYIRSRENQLRRIVFTNLVFLGIFAGALFLRQDHSHYPTLALIFGVTFVVIAVITFFQLRSARRKLDNLRLDKVRISAGTDGLSITEASGILTYPYTNIRSVVVSKDRRSDQVRSITLEIEAGRIRLPGIDSYEPLIAELKSRLGSVPFREEKK